VVNEVNLDLACEQIFGITPRRYRQLVKEYGAPPVKNGKVDLFKACKFLIEYYRKMAEGGGSATLAEEKAKLIAWQTKLKELQYKKEEKRLVDIEVVRYVLETLILRTKSKLEAIPSKLAPVIITASSLREARDILEKYIKEVLNELGDPKDVLKSIERGA